MLQLDEQAERIDALRKRISQGKKFSPESIQEWRDQPITRLLVLELQEKQIDALQEMCLPESITNPLDLSLFISTIEDVLEWTPPEVNEDD